MRLAPVSACVRRMSAPSSTRPSRFGRLDIAVNAAGTEGKPGPAVAQTAESYAATFDTNVLSTILSTKYELRVMQPQGSGSIVYISPDATS